MRLLCLCCRTITEIQTDQSLAGCPGCGDRAGIPADADDTVTLTITKHELRILTMWADNHARSIASKPGMEHMPQVIGGIFDYIGTQTDAPLSLAQEMADMRAAFPDSKVTVYRDGEKTDE